MSPDRLRAVLDILRWSQRGLAEALGCDDRLIRRWAAGTITIPLPVATWLETLAATHAAHPAPSDWRRREGPRAA